VATGRGRSLGDALIGLFAQQGRPGGRRHTYDRQGWRAQFAQLSSTTTGYAAMERAGLSATTRTQRSWLSGDVAASPANQELISKAYQAMAGGWSSSWEAKDFKISGRLTQGNDSRMRGFGRNAPLLINGSLGDWEPIEDAWNDGVDAETLEQLFIAHVVVPNLGTGSYPWKFDGDRYEVTA
jgi:hypothetical protein